MAVTIATNTTYESGSGGFLSTHTISAFNCSGSDSGLVVNAYSRELAAQLSGITADGNAMTSQVTSENTNVCGVETFDYIISNASFDIVGSTPGFKLLAMSALGLSGVNQTTMAASVDGTNTGFSTAANISYTGTSGNLNLAFVNSQGAGAMTPAGTMTELHDFDHADTNLGQCWAGYETTSGSAQTTGATLGGNDNWAVVVYEAAVAAGGVAGIRSMRQLVGTGQGTRD